MKKHQELKNSSIPSIYFACSKSVIGCLLLIGMVYPGIASAQQSQTWYSVSYHKIVPGKEHEVLTMMKTVDTKVQQERVSSGALSAWQLYEVLSRSGSSAEYNYVSVTTTKSLKGIYETGYTFDSAFKKIFSEKGAKFFADYYSKMTEGFTLVKEEIYSGIAIADSGILDGFQSKYVVVDFMQPKPDKAGQYYKSEVDTFRLIHKERIKLGAINQWAFLQYVFPFDAKVGYSYLALNFYNDLDIMFTSKYGEALKKVFPSITLGDLFKSALPLRDNPKADLWRLVLYTKQ